MAFYYLPNQDKAAWDETVDRGLFVLGVAGGVPTVTCSDDADCAIYGNGLDYEPECDNSDPSRSSYRCLRQVMPLIRDASSGDLTDGLGNE
jgi:hypothetical protein